MKVYGVGGKVPVVGKGTWIAPNAYVIGDVEIGENCFIGFGAVLRGDFGKIVIGNGCAVEDNVVIHCASRVIIGNNVIVGHKAMIHDAVIKDSALIGMQSMICDNALIGERSIIAEQSLVRKRQVIPDEKIYGGSPAEEIGAIEDRHSKMLLLGQRAYVDLTHRYLGDFQSYSPT